MITYNTDYLSRNFYRKRRFLCEILFQALVLLISLILIFPAYNKVLSGIGIATAALPIGCFIANYYIDLYLPSYKNPRKALVTARIIDLIGCAMGMASYIIVFIGDCDPYYNTAKGMMFFLFGIPACITYIFLIFLNVLKFNYNPLAAHNTANAIKNMASKKASKTPKEEDVIEVEVVDKK